MSHVWVLTRRSCHKHTYVSCVYLEKLIMSRPQNPVTLFLTRHQVVSQILPQFLDALLLHQNDLSVVLPCHCSPVSCSLSLKNHRLQLLHNKCQPVLLMYLRAVFLDQRVPHACEISKVNESIYHSCTEIYV